MRRTGLRIGELRKLERDCVREDHAGGHFLKVPLGKMNNERLVPLDADTLKVIRGLQGLTPADSEWLVRGARGRSVALQTYQQMLHRHAEGMALPDALTTHRLRHTFATSLMNGGMSLLGIMKLLGHRDQRMTLRYSQIADETVGRGTSRRSPASPSATSCSPCWLPWSSARNDAGFRMFWRRRSRPGRVECRVTAETINLVKEMATKNRLWGAERIRGELLKLGIKLSKRTVQKYMRSVRERRGGGQTWATFVKNHANDIWCCDFVQTYDLLFRPLFLSPAEPGVPPGGPYTGHAEPDPGLDGAAVAERDHGGLGAEVSDPRPRREVRLHIRPSGRGRGYAGDQDGRAGPEHESRW